ncbi:type II CAAX endopeptidase family protein [Clostridium sp. 1001271B_151109_B4]|uniref:CPBP family intramembrane glutamic endopeptidase n=1 Tax=Clostridium sp. 1001271B_151109_B4 TaxID=2787148 RepID=UPI0018AA7E37|nr:type II CAAX endopeptidase family protein [Clostridium sp. 1001271B_151109_B4]
MELKTRVDDKKVFAKIGLATFVCMIVVNVIQVIYYSVINLINPSLLQQPWINYVAIAISFYLIGFPIFYVMVKKLPDGEKRESKSLSVGKIILLFFMSYAILYVVNFLTTLLMMLIASIKGGEIINPIANVVGASNWIWSLIFVGILSPIVEEMLFRGIMLNKIRMYGDKVAIVTTAVLFGLFHANFSQFFYAVGLGVIFAYVTLKTGTIKYSIILHIAINIVGSVIMPAIVGDGSNIALIGVAGFILIAITIIGIVLLIINRKNIHLSEGEIKLEKGRVTKTIYLNVGMILYIALCVISMISVVMM